MTGLIRFAGGGFLAIIPWIVLMYSVSGEGKLRTALIANGILLALTALLLVSRRPIGLLGSANGWLLAFSGLGVLALGAAAFGASS
jgi:hypothetical protein